MNTFAEIIKHLKSRIMPIFVKFIKLNWMD